jgi:hypothetical protein
VRIRFSSPAVQRLHPLELEGAGSLSGAREWHDGAHLDAKDLRAVSAGMVVLAVTAISMLLDRCSPAGLTVEVLIRGGD